MPSHNFVKKNVLCEKGDEITRFDGIQQLKTVFKNSRTKLKILTCTVVVDDLTKTFAMAPLSGRSNLATRSLSFSAN